MEGTFVFVHGTGRQDHAGREAAIREQLATNPRLRGFDYVGIPWDELAPNDIDVAASLPEKYSAQGTIASAPEQAIEQFATEFYHESAGRAVWAEGLAKDVALRLLTDAIESHRLPLTNAVTDFLRNVIFYLRHGGPVRDFVWKHLEAVDQGAPVVIAGHSIGGVITVDIMSGPGRPPGRVDLVVTAGSQAPLLYLMDALESLRSGDRTRRPFNPWLNVYNPRDPFAFRAGEVFSWSPTPPIDAVMEHPRDLPGSHSEYFAVPRLYELIAGALDSGRR
jgi:hypothetical protein